jgi:hypothetical protein
VVERDRHRRRDLIFHKSEPGETISAIHPGLKRTLALARCSACDQIFYSYVLINGVPMNPNSLRN